MAIENEPQAQLVITAPMTHGVDLAEETQCRTTRGVLTQLFAQAEKKVVISAPFLQPGAGLAGGSLKTSLDSALSRGVNVDVVSTRRGLKTLSDLPSPASSKNYAEPGRLRLFRPEGEDAQKNRLGSHAKFCISDSKSAYIGSANLTAPGLEGNLEIGVMVRGDVAEQLQKFWTHALEIGLFVPAELGNDTDG